MSDERDELARDIPTWTNLPFGGLGHVKLDANAAYAIAGVLIEKGYRKPQQVTTAEELGAAISAAFEDARPLVVSDRSARPWIIWEDEDGDAWVESWPQEEDPERLTVADIDLPATVLHVGGAE